MKLLLISNSTNAGEEYLRYPLPEIGFAGAGAGKQVPGFDPCQSRGAVANDQVF